MYTFILPPVSFVPAAVVRHPGKGSLKKERVNSTPKFHRIAHHCREIKQQGLEASGHIRSRAERECAHAHYSVHLSPRIQSRAPPRVRVGNGARSISCVQGWFRPRTLCTCGFFSRMLSLRKGLCLLGSLLCLYHLSSHRSFSGHWKTE